MSAPIVAWIVAGLAGFACLGLLLQLRGATERVRSALVEAEEARRQAKSLRKQLEKREARQGDAGESIGELRRRLDKAKKRVVKLQAERRGEPERIADLERQLQERSEELRATREELVVQRGLLDKARSAAAAPRPEPPAAAPEPPPPPAVDTAELDALRAKVAQLESALAKEKRRAEQSRSRIKTQDKLYLAIRGELEAKKDRLKRQQEEIERLMALRASLAPPSSETTPNG